MVLIRSCIGSALVRKLLGNSWNPIGTRSEAVLKFRNWLVSCSRESYSFGCLCVFLVVIDASPERDRLPVSPGQVMAWSCFGSVSGAAQTVDKLPPCSEG